MSRSMFSFQRSGLAGLALALSAAALPAAAQQTAQQAEQQATPAADSLTVTRDPATGQLRPATAAEQASLRAAVPARARIRVAAPRVQQKIHASGARGARVTDELLSSAVAVRAPDGSIQVAHSAEEAAAQARTHTQIATPATE
jgi:hypothetical protein